ncbi:MAG: LPS assembly lipoprotein LptE [Gammaproteobacteria bacterium]|nr:LPS assembly lipoprotein LptE [Gammaproteobacteria bacterium]
MPRSQHRTLLPAALLVGATLLLAACGFQPRGQTAALAGIPSPLHIRGISPYSDLGRELGSQLQRAGVATSPGIAGSALVLHIRDYETDARVLTVDSRNRAVESELEHSLRFELRSPDDRVLAAAQTVRVLRIQLTPRETILANRRGAAQLREDMVEELAQRVLQRVAAQH